MIKFGELDPYAYYDESGERYLFFSSRELAIYLIEQKIKNLINLRN